MRHAALAALLVLVSTSAAGAQSAPWAQKLFLGVTSHDFGTCPRGAKLKHRFRFKNIYAVPLQITSMRTSCGCLTFKAGKRSLKPNEETYIDIVMDAAKFKGPKTISFYVSVGPNFVSTATIQISANARQDVVLNPGEISFGIVHTGTKATRTLDVEYAGALDWRITKILNDKAAAFEVSLTELYRQAPTGIFRASNRKSGYQLTVTLKPDAKPGTFREKVLLKTNDPESPILTVCIEGTIQAALSVRPKTVDMGTMEIGKAVTQRVVVRGKEPFRILAVDGVDKTLTARYTADRTAALQIVSIIFRPTQAGNINKTLRIRTNLSSRASVSVNVHATVKK